MHSTDLPFAWGSRRLSCCCTAFRLTASEVWHIIEPVFCTAGIMPVGNAHAQYELAIPIEIAGECFTAVRTAFLQSSRILALATM